MQGVIKPRNFRLQGQRYLLTFSQTSDYGELELVMGYHLAYLKPVEYYGVGHELHADGGHHYHLVLCFKSKVDSLRIDYFDWMFDGVHPNIKPIKQGPANLRRAIDYIKKDGHFYEDGLPPVAAKERALQLVINDIEAGLSLRVIHDNHPYAAMSHWPKIVAHFNRVVQYRARDGLKSWHLLDVDRSLQLAPPKGTPAYPWYVGVALIKAWLNDNILVSRGPTQKHLWIHGPPRIGKSRLQSQLSKFVYTCSLPVGEGWSDGFDDECDLVFLNDFSGGWLPGDIKVLCEQSLDRTMLKVKGGFVTKSRNQPVIVTANNSIRDTWPNGNVLNVNAVAARFVEVWMPQDFNIFPDPDISATVYVDSLEFQDRLAAEAIPKQGIDRWSSNPQ